MRTTLVLIVLLGAICASAQTHQNISSLQRPQADAAEPNALQPLTAERELTDVRIRGNGIASLLADLSLWYDIPIGLEIAMNTSEFSYLRMNLKKATLGEVLNQFVAEHREYAWEIRDGVVNVFPRDDRQDPIVKQILGTEIGTFSIKEKTVTFTVEANLLATPELEALMKGYGLTKPGWSFSGFYFPNVGPKFKLNASNMTVRSILNNVIKESKTATFWSISRNSSEHTLSIRMAANHENARKAMRKADFEDLEAELENNQGLVP